jgi:hypothetical protein
MVVKLHKNQVAVVNEKNLYLQEGSAGSTVMLI